MNPKILAQKEQAVKDIEAKAKEASAVIVLEYRGLSVIEIQDLRRALKAVNAEIGVYKNSIVRRAVTNAGHPDFTESLTGPNAVVFGTDAIETPKALFKYSRTHEKLVIKAGLVDGRILDTATLKDLSRLPGKNGLISMVLSVLQAPVRQLACILDAVRVQKEAN